jgi:hypothetical protein
MDDEKDRLVKTFRGCQDGTIPVASSNLGRQMRIKEQSADDSIRLEKHSLTKRSKKCGQLKHRYFDIDNGRLNVYKYNYKHSRASHVYELKNVADVAKMTVQTAKDKDIGEPFDKRHGEFRVMLKCKERNGPIFLYSKNKNEQQAKKLD